MKLPQTPARVSVGLNMKKAVWTVFKVLGMLFVIVSCVVFIKRMAMVGAMTGNYVPLAIVLLVDCVLVYWAYRVIWNPISPKE
jgi:hypothetical protein